MRENVRCVLAHHDLSPPNEEGNVAIVVAADQVLTSRLVRFLEQLSTQEVIPITLRKVSLANGSARLKDWSGHQFTP